MQAFFPDLTPSRGTEILLAFPYRYAGVMDVRSDIFPGTPRISSPHVSVRLARFARWDRLMDQHHYLASSVLPVMVCDMFSIGVEWVGLATGWAVRSLQVPPS